ncbi:MAG: hypothetical protein V4726_24285 [Verrucomicrobiota bacterium]
MARASAASVPAPALSPFWEAAAFRWGVLAVAALGLLAGVIWLEKVNRHYQVERRLQEDPRLGPIARMLKGLVEENQRSGILSDPVRAEKAHAVQAVWLGRVSALVENGMRDGSTLELSDAVLLAGRPGRHDIAGKFKAGRRSFVFQGARPREGETWLVSVWRDQSGMNAIHYASRYSPGK